MIFKSFNQFLTESNSASFSPINEKQDEVFKLKQHSAETGAGESANFSIVAKFNPSNDATEDQALNLIKAYTEKELSNNEKFKSAAKGAVVFITIDRLIQRNLRLINNDQAVLRAVLSFRMADRFDMTKAAGLTPYMKPGGIAIWLDTDMAKLAIEGQTVDPKSEANQAIIKNETETESKTKEPIKPVELPAADAEVLAFLKEKLLGDAGKTALAKSGIKSREVKFAQLILLDDKFSTALPNLKLSTTLGSADGAYGPKTALAYGIILDDKFDNPHNSIEAVDIEKLAKYCTVVKLLKPRLEEIWKASDLTKSGTPGTSGTAGTAGTSGTAGQQGFIYINKPV